jgi:hypothetical protein
MMAETFINQEQKSTIRCSLKEINKCADEFQNFNHEVIILFCEAICPGMMSKLDEKRILKRTTKKY